MQDSPTAIPPTPLKIVTAGLVMLFVGVPIFALIKSGRLGSVPLVTACGFTFVVIGLGLMFLHRILLWIYYRFYWYVMAVVYAILFMIAVVAVVTLITDKQLAAVDNVPAWTASLFIPGAIVALIVIVLVFRYGRTPRASASKPAPAPVVPTPAPPPQKQILNTAQQIAARKSNLGLNDKDKSS